MIVPADKQQREKGR